MSVLPAVSACIDVSLKVSSCCIISSFLSKNLIPNKTSTEQEDDTILINKDLKIPINLVDVIPKDKELTEIEIWEADQVRNRLHKHNKLNIYSEEDNKKFITEFVRFAERKRKILSDKSKDSKEPVMMDDETLTTIDLSEEDINFNPELF
jgi:hypothetical protein